MDFLERDLEDLIFNTDNETLNNRGLYIEGKKYRQLRIGNYGIADIVTFNRVPNTNRLLITVYELKKSRIGVDSFMQAVGYVKGITRYLESRTGKKFEIQTKIILVGKHIEYGTNFTFLEDFISYFKLESYIYNYDIDGLTFTQIDGYLLKDEGFKNKLKWELTDLIK